MADSDRSCSASLAADSSSNWSSHQSPSAARTRQPHRRTVKTSFLGVFALSRPGTSYAATPRQTESSTGLQQATCPEDCNSTTSRKRQKTRSDGRSRSRSNAHSFDPRVRVASSKQPLPTSAEHLRLENSLERLTSVNNFSCTYAPPPEARSTDAGTSKGSFSLDTTSGAAVIATKAELATPLPAASAAASRKRKGRPDCMPCIELDEIHTFQSHRASSTAPAADVCQIRRIGVSEIPDRTTPDDRCSPSEKQSCHIPMLEHAAVTEQKRAGPTVLSAADATLPTAQPQQDVVSSRDCYAPFSILPFASAEDSIASQEGNLTTPASLPLPSLDLKRYGKDMLPSEVVSRLGDTVQTASQGTEAHEDCQGPMPTCLPTTSASVALRSLYPDQISASEDLVCAAYSENNTNGSLWFEATESGPEQPQKQYSSIQREEVTISQRAQQTYASHTEKSITFATVNALEGCQYPKRCSPIKTVLKAVRRKRVAGEYFVGESEKYLPSDPEGQSNGFDVANPQSKPFADITVSSRLTSPSSRKLRSASFSDKTGLEAFPQSTTRCSRNGRADTTNNLGSRPKLRRVVESDSDAEVLLRRLKMRSQHKYGIGQIKQAIASARPARSLKPFDNFLQHVPISADNRTGSRTVITRSRSIGQEAECRQCHQCETYQPMAKTLGCMTCERVTCSSCLSAYYSLHPSYAATLSYLQVDPMTRMPSETVNVSQIDFRCPVCKHLCRCATCLRGTPSVQSLSPSPVTFPAKLASSEKADAKKADAKFKSGSLPSSNAGLEPLYSQSLVQGISTLPNIKNRLRVNRTAPPSRFSKTAQQTPRPSASSKSYYDLQDAIAGEAARRAQVDAETDFVPVVSSRKSPRSLVLSRQQALPSTSQTASSDGNESDVIKVATSRRPRPVKSARVRLATKVGQRLGKSPAYVESRRSPRREGDQLFPYNNNEPVLTLAPEIDLRDSESQDSCQSNVSAIGEPTGIASVGQGVLDDNAMANELLESLLELPDNDLSSEDLADIPPLDNHPATIIDQSSPSDTLTTISASSPASPVPYEERSVRFALPGTYFCDSFANPISIFRLGVDEEDLPFPFSSPSSTSTLPSRSLQNHVSLNPAIKTLASPGISFCSDHSYHNTMHDSLYGSPSRHIAFDIDLMPQCAFDNFVQT